MRRTNAFLAMAMTIMLAAGCARVPLSATTIDRSGPRYHLRMSPVEAALLLNTPLFKQVRYITTEINAFRAGHGLPALTFDATLTRASAGHVMDMAARNYETHETPDSPPRTIADRLTAAGVSFNYNGEITATTTYNDANPATHAIDFWEHSPPHIAQMLTPEFKRMGVFLTRRASDGKWYYNVDFAD